MAMPQLFFTDSASAAAGEVDVVAGGDGEDDVGPVIGADDALGAGGVVHV